MSPVAFCRHAAVALFITYSVHTVAALEDVLLRSDAQWETMEAIHRHGVDARIGQVVDRGTFSTSVNLGYGGEFNWVDVWGPTYVCPTMEHVGTIGDGGKWVCGVETMLQRCDCCPYKTERSRKKCVENEAVEYITDTTII
jgi:hypothetical protein